MIILPKLKFARPGLANALKTAFSKNKIGLAVIGYFLLEIFFFGGYGYALKKLPKEEPLKPFLGMIENEATESADLPEADSEAPQPQWASASTFPTWGTPNNKFGMYINADPGQIAEAAPLINSNGGAWGWVLVPMSVRERGHNLWQNIFDACKAHRVKPLIQLFNNNTCDVNEMDFPGLAEFFNGLSWPTKHLYVSVFNEVNAKDYWCEKLATEDYAVVLNTAIDAFKSVNPNFFVMPAGFNS